MSNIIKHIHIEKLFGTTNIDWELNPSVNVLVGKNGSGKSTILKIVNSVLLEEYSDELKLISNCVIDFSNNLEFKWSSEEISEDEVFKILLKGFNSDETKQRLVSLLEPITDEVNDKNIDVILRDIIPHLIEHRKKPVVAKKFVSNKEIQERINIEFISTINMSANSINEITTSSGQHTNFLDFEIINEVQRLLSFDNKETLTENLLSALNSLFSETNKVIEFSNNKLVVKLTNGTQIDFSQLSSGERQVIFIFLKVVIASVDGALILMDEPEISLHLSWQEKLLNEIRRVNTTSQIIIVTHSPAMLMNGWIDSFVDIENIMTDVSTSNVSISEKDEE